MSVILTATQKEVIRKIIYAVETGGQVYGNVRYDDFTEAYAKPYTLNNVYKACQSDTGNQVGAYKLRQKMVYESLKKYITDKGNNTNMITKAINAIINIALAEVGYLEKATNANLDDKTANAGSNNYTKYWRDIYPAYQGQPWCACFVTWVFVIAFGKAMAQKLLKHYPYVYCPTMADLFTLNANPKVGDIVIFKHNGVFTHTGIVIKVSGDQFWTVEGNTSGGSTIIANGGAVCKKTYFNSNLPGTKFITPDYSKVQEIKNEGNDTPSISASSILKIGSNGSAVKTLQKNLNTLIKAKLTVDGEFGTATYNAVIKFQTKYKLTADGIVGENTQKKINSLLKKKNNSTATTHSTKSVVGEVTANELNVRSWYGIDSSTGKKYPTIVSYPKLKKTNRVSILATYKVNGETWYKIAINNAATKNKDVIGFVCGKCADGTYVKIV